MSRREYFRHSKRVTSTRRWNALRWEVLKRDGFKCVQCQSKRHLQVDHIRAVRDYPEGSYEIGNLQALCRRCHSAKTRIEIHGELPPERLAWKNLVMEM